MITVLFVDDEPHLLDGLRRVLRPMRDRWNMLFVASAQEALQTIERQPTDVVVSDMRMPEMDGMELLRAVKTEHPHVARIVLSGQTDQQEALRAVGAAQEFLHKPCDPETLTQTIERTYTLSQELQQAEPIADPPAAAALASVSEVMEELNELLCADDVDATAVGSALRRNEGVAAALVDLLNATIRSPQEQMTDVADSLEVLGVDNLRDFVAAAALFYAADVASGGEPSNIERRNLQMVTTAQLLGGNGRRHYPLIGAVLLQDIGAELLAASVEDVDVATARLLRDWGLPYDILAAVAWSSKDVPAPPWERSLLHLVHLTRVIHERGSEGAATLPEGYVAALGCTALVEEALRQRDGVVNGD